MTYSEEKIAEEMARLQKELKALRKQKRAAKVRPFAIERAHKMHARIVDLDKRADILRGTLRRRCPHDWKNGSTYHAGDYDQSSYTSYWRECRACMLWESLEKKP